MDQQHDRIDARFIFDWLPHILIFGGLLLTWIGWDVKGVVMYAGFAGYGVFGIVELVKMRRRSMLVFLKFIVLGLIAAIATASLFVGNISFITVMMLVIMDRLILTPSRVFSDR